MAKKKKKKKKSRKCETKFCRNRKPYQRRYCWKCVARKYKVNNPEMYLFHCRKGNAKKRGIEWQITFDQFKKFIHDTGYITKRGIKPGSMTIDRERHKEGYHINNIRVLRHDVNSTKGFYEKMGIPFYQGEVPF